MSSEKKLLYYFSNNSLKSEPILIILGRPFVNGSPYAIGPLSCLSVCGVDVLRPKGWMDQDET